MTRIAAPPSRTPRARVAIRVASLSEGRYPTRTESWSPFKSPPASLTDSEFRVTDSESRTAAGTLAVLGRNRERDTETVQILNSSSQCDRALLVNLKNLPPVPSWHHRGIGIELPVTVTVGP